MCCPSDSCKPGVYASMHGSVLGSDCPSDTWKPGVLAPTQGSVLGSFWPAGEELPQV